MKIYILNSCMSKKNQMRKNEQNKEILKDDQLIEATESSSREAEDVSTRVS